jgi:hypothetical protein
MKRFARMPSPAMVVACLALFVALSGVSYAVATIGSDDIVNGSIRNRDFKDGTLRGNEAKPDGFGPNAIKEQVLDSSKFNAAKIGKVTGAAVADGLTRHGVVSSAGALVRGRGVTSAAKTGLGQYQVVFDVDVRNCTYFATLGDESASAPGTGQISVTSAASNVNGVRVVTRNSAGDANVDRSFHLTVSC